MTNESFFYEKNYIIRIPFSQTISKRHKIFFQYFSLANERGKTDNAPVSEQANDMKRTIVLLCASVCAFCFLGFPRTAKAETPERRMLPILMYHSVLNDVPNAYRIRPDTLEADLAELKRRGYVSVSLGEVIQFVKGSCDLPEKPVLLTFDDGHYNNLFYAMEILKKQGFSAVLNVIGRFTEYSSTHEKDHPEYSHLTWDEIGTAARSGVFEIGNHSYAMHAYKPRFGVKRKKGESAEEYEAALREDTLRLEYELMQKSGVRPRAYAYPFGAYSDETENILRSLGYEAIFTCYERVNVIERGNTEKLFRLYRINRDGRVETDRFLDEHGI